MTGWPRPCYPPSMPKPDPIHDRIAVRAFRKSRAIEAMLATMRPEVRALARRAELVALRDTAARLLWRSPAPVKARR